MRTLIVVGGLAAIAIGAGWALTANQPVSSQEHLAANGFDQSIVRTDGQSVSNIKVNEALSLPAMYAAVPLSRVSVDQEMTRAPAPPLTATEPQDVHSELLDESLNKVVAESKDALSDPSTVVLKPSDLTSVTPAPSPSGQTPSETSITPEADMATALASADVEASKPVDYGRLNQRLLQVADALERLNLRLAALAGPRQEQPTADATESPVMKVEADDLKEG